MGAYREFLDRHLPGHSFGVTVAAGDEYRLTEQAIHDGYDLIIAVGGDGTWSHVADQILLTGNPEIAFAMLPSGTGNDFGRNLGLSFSDPAAAVQAIAGGSERRVDVGRVETATVPSPIGKAAAARHAVGAARPTAEPPRIRHFLNLIGLGFDIAVIDAAASARFLKGELLYKITALKQLFRFPGASLQAEDGAGWSRDGRHLMVTISNGRYFGGGFPIAPDATIDDGLLHACLIGDASPLQRMKLFGLAEKGLHVSDERVEVRSGARFLLNFQAPVRFEVDGDVFRTMEGELEVSILPRALTVVGA